MEPTLFNDLLQLKGQGHCPRSRRLQRRTKVTSPDVKAVRELNRAVAKRVYPVAARERQNAQKLGLFIAAAGGPARFAQNRAGRADAGAEGFCMREGARAKCPQCMRLSACDRLLGVQCLQRRSSPAFRFARDNPAPCSGFFEHP